MANNTVGDYVVHESDYGNSPAADDENLQSIDEDVVDDNSITDKDVVDKTTNSKRDVADTQSVKTIKTAKDKDVIGDPIPVNTYGELKELLENPSSSENLIVDLTGSPYASTGDITVNSNIKNLTINGNSVIIDCDGTNRFLLVKHSINLTLNRLIVNRACANDDGAVLRVDGSYSNITINDSLFDGNKAKGVAGSVVYQESNGQLKIINSKFTNNQALRYGGAIHQEKNSNLTIIGSNFVNNTVKGTNMDMIGGAIYQDEKSNLNIIDSCFENNSAEIGAAIYQGINCKLNIVDSNFTKNNADKGSAVYQEINSILSTTGSLFKNNDADSGGVLDQENNCSITSQNSKFISNNVLCGSINQEDSCNATIIGSEFTSNIANSRGGAIYSENNGILNIIGSNFTNNQAPIGGAISLDGSSKLTIDNSKFTDNQAKRGEGGAIYQNSNSELKITDSKFEKNHCTYKIGSGGAIYQHESGNIILDGVSFIENSALSKGGAIYQYSYGTMTILNSNFTSNTAPESGGAIANKLAKNLIINDTSFSNGESNFGGAIYSENNAELNRCNFTKNVATTSGGAILSPTNLVVNSCNFIENTAQYGGAIVDYTGHSNNTGNMAITNSNFTKNYASSNAATLYVKYFALVTLEDNVFDSNWVGNTSGWVLRLQEDMKVINNLFVNNTDNERDMLFNILAKEVHDNTYIDNYLEDSWENIKEPVYLKVNEEKEVFLVNLRDVYNSTIVNGTIICYLKDSYEEIARFDVKDGSSKLKFDTSKLNPGLNTIKLSYVSLSKHYQNLNRTLDIFFDAPVSVNVTKIWDDDNNINRPNNVTIILYNKDTHVEVNRTVLNATDWTYSFKNLDLIDSKGNIINYTVDELDVLGYVKVVKNSSAYVFTVTNIYAPETIDIKVLIAWDDSNNNDRIRPDYVKVQLYSNGKEFGEPVIIYATSKTVTLGKNQQSNIRTFVNRNTIAVSSTDNQYVFKNLPKYDKDGKLITYTVDEIEVPTGYTKTVTNANNVFTITNTHIIDNVDFTVDVVWKGTGNRPNSIKIQLYADGKSFGKPVTLATDKNKEYVFKNLPKYKDGKLVKYTADLVKIPKGFKESKSESQYSLIIKLVKSPNKTSFKWSWKLVKISHKTKHYKKNAEKHTKYTKHSIIKKALKANNKLKYTKNSIKYRKYLKYANRNKWNRYSKHNGKKYTGRVTYKYRLYIYLYSKYMNGSMSYNDFVAILKENNIKVSKSNWDKNGVLVIDYNDIKDVPDTITLHNKKGDVPDSTSKVNKTKAKKSKNTISEDEVDKKADYAKSTNTEGVVDSDEIKVGT